MAIPDFQTLMLPVLRTVASNGSVKSAAIRAAIANELNLSDADLQEMLPSKLQGTFHNRVAPFPREQQSRQRQARIPLPPPAGFVHAAGR